MPNFCKLHGVPLTVAIWLVGPPVSRREQEESGGARRDIGPGLGGAHLAAGGAGE